MRNILRVIFVFFIAILLLPVLQDSFHIFKIRPLSGAFEILDKPELNHKNWWFGEFQDKFTAYKAQNMEIRPLLVRVNNQFDFSLFNKSNATKVVVGKHNYLFEDNYIDAYIGNDYIGINEIKKRLNRATRVQQILKSTGVDLVFVFLPGKATFFSEYIPERYIKAMQDSTNYDVFVKECKNSGLNYIDFNEWFLNIKDTVSYPLYPKCGIHWSYYGMYLVADSITNYLNDNLNNNLPEVKLLSVDVSEEQKGTDYDIGHTLNLMFPIKTYPMPYPNIGYNSNGKTKPDVLVVGDSYYWNLYYSGIPENVFKELDFWYYNHNIHNDGTSKVANTTDNIDYKANIIKRDVILVMQTDGGLNNFGLGFFEKAEQNLNADAYNLRLEYYKNKILNDSEWQNHIREKAVNQGISFEEMLERDARYMVQQED
jgi:hypothetical protein